MYPSKSPFGLFLLLIVSARFRAVLYIVEAGRRQPRIFPLPPALHRANLGGRLPVPPWAVIFCPFFIGILRPFGLISAVLRPPSTGGVFRAFPPVSAMIWQFSSACPASAATHSACISL